MKKSLNKSEILFCFFSILFNLCLYAQDLSEMSSRELIQIMDMKEIIKLREDINLLDQKSLLDQNKTLSDKALVNYFEKNEFYYKSTTDLEKLLIQNNTINLPIERILKVLDDRFKRNFGEDDRMSINEISPKSLELEPFIDFSDSVCAIFKDITKFKRSGDFYIYKYDILKNKYGLCEKVKYNDEPSASVGTAFLISEDILVTAAHCIENERDLKKSLFVFDYKMDIIDKATGIIKIPVNNIYIGKKILGRNISDHQDWAVIKLKKKTNRIPLKINESYQTKSREKVFALGHPLGLPMKISPKGEIVEISTVSFTTNLDTFGGSSGSPVFNNKYEVIGIFYSDWSDFEIKIIKINNDCNLLYKIDEQEKGTAGVNKISNLKSVLNEFGIL